jgi:hypothetical protein
VTAFHTFKKPPFDFGAYRKTQSYSNTPTDGIWLRAPYLHNGSVPTLWDLLQPPENARWCLSPAPMSTTRSTSVSSPRVPRPASADFKYDTRLEGNHNSGHLYGTTLSDDDKRALIEFMKTL